jgi:hypothetical protein
MRGDGDLVVIVAFLFMLVLTFFNVWAWRLGAAFAREPVRLASLGKFALGYFAFVVFLIALSYLSHRSSGEAYAFPEATLGLLGPFLMLFPIIGFAWVVGWASNADFSAIGWSKRYGPERRSDRAWFAESQARIHKADRDG